MAAKTPPKLALGQLILAALVAVTSKLTKPARDAFVKAFQALFAAQTAVQTADTLVDDATKRCQAADAAQDRATLELATKMAGDGFGRLNPFKAFGVFNPTKTTELSNVDEANTLIDLAARVASHPNSSAATKKAAAAVATAAKEVLTAERARVKALKQRADAVEFRDRDLPQAYALALRNLRASIQFADYAEGTTNYDNVFRPLRRAPKKKPAPAPVS